MSSNNHPLPSPPGQQSAPYYNQQQPQQYQQQYQQQHQQQHPQQYQQTRPEQRPRAKSNFSFHSRKSSGSAGGAKVDLTESHDEKESKRLHTKADPLMALSEAEPSAVASGVKSSLAPIRGMQYRDSLGNPIADPDRSNPTRSRWERPLDTIRSFEAAIDGNYKRQSYMRSESGDNPQFNRRSSYFGGTQVTSDERPRHPQSGYYGRSQSSRPESQYTMDNRQSYYGNDNGGPSNSYAPNRARYPRNASDPRLNAQGVYPAPGNQNSYETVTTASGSSGEQIGYSTENSSVDRITPLPQMKESGDNYGFSGFGNNPQNLTPGFNHYSVEGQNGAQRQGSYQNQGQPQVPRSELNAPRVPMKLGNSNGNAQNEKPAPVEKRKSWLGRRFSKA